MAYINLSSVKFALQSCPITPAPPVKVSVRVTYKLQEAFDQQWTRNPEEFHSESVEELRSLLHKQNFSLFPFGAVQDPLQ